MCEKQVKFEYETKFNYINSDVFVTYTTDLLDNLFALLKRKIEKGKGSERKERWSSCLAWML